MRGIALALALGLLSAPAFAKKGPAEGRFCSKKKEGKTSKDKAGNELTCKKDDQGKYRWTK